MSEYHVIARESPLPASGEMRWTFDCPRCDRSADSACLMDWEFTVTSRTVFCGRWGCDALLHVHRPASRALREIGR